MKMKPIKTARSPLTNLLPFCIEKEFVGRDKGLDIYISRSVRVE